MARHKQQAKPESGAKKRPQSKSKPTPTKPASAASALRQPIHDVGQLNDADQQTLQRTYGNQFVQRASRKPSVMRQEGSVTEGIAEYTDDALDTFEENALDPENLAAPAPPPASADPNAGNNNSPPLPPDIESRINAARGNGQPLPEQTQQEMGDQLGADFSNVSVHDDAESDKLARSLNARAFTTSSDIFFRQGEYDPDNESGQKLLAHELTHVVQQGAAQRKTHTLDNVVQMDDDKKEEEKSKEEIEKEKKNAKSNTKSKTDNTKEQAKDKGRATEKDKGKDKKKGDSVKGPKSAKKAAPKKLSQELPVPEAEIDPDEVKYDPELEHEEPEMDEERLPTWDELVEGTIQMSAAEVQQELDYRSALGASDGYTALGVGGSIDVSDFEDEDGEIDRGALIGDALKEGALEGLKEGAVSVISDQIFQAATSKIPYADGMINTYRLVQDPNLWYQENVAVIGQNFGKLGSSFSAIGDEDTAWGYIAATLEAIVDVIDAVYSIINLINVILTIILFISKALVILGNAMIALAPVVPFCIMCWTPAVFTPIVTFFSNVIAIVDPVNNLITTIGNVLLLVKFGLQPLIILFRSLDLLESKANPEKLMEKQAKLKGATSSFVKEGTERAGARAAGAASEGIQKHRDKKKVRQAERDLEVARSDRSGSESEVRQRRDDAQAKLDSAKNAYNERYGKRDDGTVEDVYARDKDKNVVAQTFKKKFTPSRPSSIGKDFKDNVINVRQNIAKNRQDVAKRYRGLQEASKGREETDAYQERKQKEEAEAQVSKTEKADRRDEAKKISDTEARYQDSQRDATNQEKRYSESKDQADKAGERYESSQREARQKSEAYDTKKREAETADMNAELQKRTADKSERELQSKKRDLENAERSYESARQEAAIAQRGSDTERHRQANERLQTAIADRKKARQEVEMANKQYQKDKQTAEKAAAKRTEKQLEARQAKNDRDTARERQEKARIDHEKARQKAEREKFYRNVMNRAAELSRDERDQAITDSFRAQQTRGRIKDEASDARARERREYQERIKELNKKEWRRMGEDVGGWTRFGVGKQGGQRHGPGPVGASGKLFAEESWHIGDLLTGYYDKYGHHLDEAEKELNAANKAKTEEDARPHLRNARDELEQVDPDELRKKADDLDDRIKWLEDNNYNPGLAGRKREQANKLREQADRADELRARAKAMGINIRSTSEQWADKYGNKIFKLVLNSDGIPPEDDDLKREDKDAAVFVVHNAGYTAKYISLTRIRYTGYNAEISQTSGEIWLYKGQSYPITPQPVTMKQTKTGDTITYKPTGQKSETSGDEVTVTVKYAAATNTNVQTKVQRLPDDEAAFTTLDTPPPAPANNGTDLVIQRQIDEEEETAALDEEKEAQAELKTELQDILIAAGEDPDIVDTESEALAEETAETEPEAEDEFSEEEEDEALEFEEEPEEEDVDYTTLLQMESQASLLEMLPEPPEDVIATVQGAALAYNQVDVEAYDLLLQRQEMQQMQQHGEGQMSEIKATRAMTEVQQMGVEQHQQDVETKLEAQAEMQEATNEQEKAAQKTADQGAQGQDFLSSIFSSLLQSFGFGSAVGVGDSADSGTLKQGTGDQAKTTAATAEATKEATDFTKQRTADTLKVKGEAAQVQGELDEFDSITAEEEASAEEGIAELEEAQDLNEEQLSGTQDEKTRLQEDHGSAMEEAEAWAAEHRAVREEIFSQLEADLSDGETAEQEALENE